MHLAFSFHGLAIAVNQNIHSTEWASFLLAAPSATVEPQG